MNSETRLIKSCLGLLKLAEHLNNVTKACKLMGTSGTVFTGRNIAEQANCFI